MMACWILPALINVVKVEPPLTKLSGFAHGPDLGPNCLQRLTVRMDRVSPFTSGMSNGDVCTNPQSTKKHLLHIFDECKFSGKQCGPRPDCYYLIWVVELFRRHALH